MTKQWKFCIAIFFVLLQINADAQSSIDEYASNSPLPSLQKDSIKISDANKDIPFIVGDIYIKGNKKTKRYIILRELTFKKGDTITLVNLVKAFGLGHDRIFNTLLFTDVVVYLKGFRGYHVDVEIDVVERWYMIPVPYFKYVDRNLTVWQEHGYSLSRVNYGLKYTQNNFTGRNDNMNIWLITGYSRQAEISYNQPYADKTLKHGFGFSVIYAANKEMNVSTVNNQQNFIDADTLQNVGKFLSTQWTFSLKYFFRPALKIKHLLRLNLIDLHLDSVVNKFNPNYLTNSRTQTVFPEALYQIDYQDVDYIGYPLKGVMATGSLLHRGLNAEMNLWQLNLQSTESVPLFRKTYFSTQNMATLKWPLNQPFYNQQLFGYGNFYLRGLEAYVIDGESGFIARNSLLREIFDFSLPAYIPFLGLYRVPFKVMAKTYFDVGYVYNNQPLPTNTLSNKLLYSSGFGIDIATSYDFVFRFEYSFNQLGGKGVFLHIHNDF